MTIDRIEHFILTVRDVEATCTFSSQALRDVLILSPALPSETVGFRNRGAL